MSEAAVTRAPTVRALRIVAVAEAVSWLLLIVATIVKYSADAPLGVHIMGPVHGVLFLAYVGLALDVRSRLGWDARTSLIVLADAIIPGGGFVVARRRDLEPTVTA
jgi:integral membrane protein